MEVIYNSPSMYIIQKGRKKLKQKQLPLPFSHVFSRPSPNRKTAQVTKAKGMTKSLTLSLSLCVDSICALVYRRSYFCPE
jgi:hypothetical protein